MNKNSKIYLAGNKGLVGSAIERRLASDDYINVVTSDIGDFNLTDPKATDAFFEKEKPEYVFLAAAKVGGINANDSFPADFIRINLQIQTNLAEALLFLMKKFDALKNDKDEDVFINVGVGKDVTIKEAADLVKSVVGFNGEIRWNKNMPDGTPRKLLDVTRLHNLGWRESHTLRMGLEKVYAWYLSNRA